MRTSLDVGATRVDEARRAVAEPRRRAILELVATEELAAGAVAARVDVTRTAISQHLTVLEDARRLVGAGRHQEAPS